jgi:G:T-mismatch repair DNA endonuclease (very short patch repair protein)
MKELKKVKCHICEELGVLKEFKSTSVGIHLNAAHPNVTLEEYYLRYINPDAEGKCKFCGDKAVFLGLTRGYRNNCKSKECLKKATNPYSKEYKMKVEGLSEEGYIEWQKKDAEEKRERTIKGFAEARLRDPNFDKKNSRYCKEFWESKGHTPEEAEKLAWDETQKNRDKLKEIVKEDPNYLSGKNWNSYQYWMEKGHTEEEAKKIVSEKQVTFSKEKCIERYGEEEGLKVWQERQRKWMETLDSKSDEEKLEILKKKIFYNKIHSKNSQELFKKIESFFPSEDFFFATSLNEEKKIETISGEFFKPDFCWKNKIIEFFGTYWHCDPNHPKYGDPSFAIRRGSKKYTAASVWKIDKWRIEELQRSGYEVLVIWESEWDASQEDTVARCLEFLRN